MLVSTKDNLIISGSNDRTIRIWDLESERCLKILKGHTNSVSSVFVYDNKIISGSVDKTIRIIPITQFPGEFPVYVRVLSWYSTNKIIAIFVLDFFKGG
jgi:WD40 repeat protein